MQTYTNRNKNVYRTRNHSVFFIVLIFVGIAGMTAGCLDRNIPNRSSNLNNFSNVSLSPTPTPSPETTYPLSYLVYNTDQITAKIRELFGDPNMPVDYIRTEHFAKGNVSIFRTKKEIYVVNTATLEMANGSYVNADEKSYENIARIYSTAMFPELWNLSDKKGIKPLLKEKLCYSWRDIYEYPDKNTPNHIEISGLNFVYINLSGEVGFLEKYWITDSPLNPNLNLQPTLSEDQAWEIAKNYYAMRDVRDVLPNERSSYGLNIVHGINQTACQNDCLSWNFVVKQKSSLRGGMIFIDAHNGQILYYDEY
jgi:hypothetical protein